MNTQTKEMLIELIKQDKSIPSEFEKVLFPNVAKEYEISYKEKASKESILSVSEEPQAVPFQVEKEFNIKQECKDDWRNLLIFGDNFQALKTIYENKDQLISGNIKGKVKLIYIDPPFATKSDFSNKDGEKEAIKTRLLDYMWQSGYSLMSDSKEYYALSSFIYNYIKSAGNRDNIYDEYKMIVKNIITDEKLLRKCIVFYNAIGGEKDIDNLNFKMLDAINFDKIKRQLKPIISKKDTFAFLSQKFINIFSNVLYRVSPLLIKSCECMK